MNKESEGTTTTNQEESKSMKGEQFDSPGHLVNNNQLKNPKEIPIPNANHQNSARKSEYVGNEPKKHKAITRIQSEVDVNIPSDSPVEGERANSSNYNPVISRQTTYRGDSFGNKEGLKKTKARKETYTEDPSEGLEIPEPKRNMKSVIREETDNGKNYFSWYRSPRIS